jgi:hypothetical protein
MIKLSYFERFIPSPTSWAPKHFGLRFPRLGGLRLGLSLSPPASQAVE